MSTKTPPNQSGFALILALLALLLLTSLGLSLSTTTGTELQISTNHRWTESARYNAEAGLEYAKRVLAAPTLDWSTLLPTPRVGWAATVTPGAPAFAVVPGSRSYENYACDSRGNGVGYGAILNQGTPLQYATAVPGLGFSLNGAFTVWVRRPVVWVADPSAAAGQFQDYAGNDVLVLVSEGVAPYTGANNDTGSLGARILTASNRSTYVLESVVSKSGSAPPCESRSGQSGGSAQGTNSWGCISTGSVTDAIAGITGAGAGSAK